MKCVISLTLGFLLFSAAAQAATRGEFTNSGPALVTYQGKLYTAFPELRDRHHIRFAEVTVTKDGKVYMEKSKKLRARTRTTPALAVYNGKLYMAYVGAKKFDRKIRLRSFDGKRWSERENLPYKSGYGPELVVHDGKLHLFWTVEGGRLMGYQSIRTASFDGSKWTRRQFVNRGARRAASGVSFKDHIYLVFQAAKVRMRGPAPFGQVVSYKRKGKGKWKLAHTIVQGRSQTGKSPALVVHDSKLYVAYAGKGGRCAPVFWGNFETKDIYRDVKTCGRPSLASFKGHLILGYEDRSVPAFKILKP